MEFENKLLLVLLIERLKVKSNNAEEVVDCIGRIN